MAEPGGHSKASPSPNPTPRADDRRIDADVAAHRDDDEVEQETERTFDPKRPPEEDVAPV